MEDKTSTENYVKEHINDSDLHLDHGDDNYYFYLPLFCSSWAICLIGCLITLRAERAATHPFKDLIAKRVRRFWYGYTHEETMPGHACSLLLCRGPPPLLWLSALMRPTVMVMIAAWALPQKSTFPHCSVVSPCAVLQ